MIAKSTLSYSIKEADFLKLPVRCDLRQFLFGLGRTRPCLIPYPLTVITTLFFNSPKLLGLILEKLVGLEN